MPNVIMHLSKPMKVYQEGGLRYKLQTLDDNAGSVKVYHLYKKKYCPEREIL